MSSAGSAGRGAPGLERRGSSGSMTERTFRCPSPHRGERGRSPHRDRPPVPAIPARHHRSTSAAAGVGMQNFRTASQKIEAGLPSWYTHPTGDPGNVRKSDAPMRAPVRSPPPAPLNITSPPPQRSDSRSSSINFSYPNRLRGASPPASPSADYDYPIHNPPLNAPASPPRSSRASVSSSTTEKADQTLVYDPNSRRMVPRAKLVTMKYQLREAAGQPRKVTRESGGVQRSGSHLARGTVGRVKGTTIDDAGRQNEMPRPRTMVEAPARKEEAQVLEETVTETVVAEPVSIDRRKEEASQPRPPEPERVEIQAPLPIPQESVESVRQTSNPSTSKSFARKPSVVMEEPEEEEEEEEEDVEPVIIPSREGLDSLDAVTVRQTLSRQAPKPYSEQSAVRQDGWVQSHAHPEPTQEVARERIPPVLENRPVLEVSRQNGSARRSASNSPVRTARFSSSPPENLAVRHTPLPRSASPIKSALKHSSSSPREASPSDSPDRQIATPDLDPAVTRKKSVRVSFDDRSPVVVGEAASMDDPDTPVLPSPQQQTKRPWYSNIGRSKKKEFTLDDDEIMKPRPALPSFGSIREKKLREPEEERPLIRPYDRTHPAPALASPAIRPYSPPEAVESNQQENRDLGQSNDQAIGSVLAQDQNLRNEANTSRLREPLPPIVTSAEGYTHGSDFSSSSDSEEDHFKTADDSDEEVIHSTQTTNVESHDNSQCGSRILDEKISAEVQKPTVDVPRTIGLPATEIPDISVTHPTPVPSDKTLALEVPKEPKERLYFGIPGGFPEEESDDSRITRQKAESNPNTSNMPRDVNTIFEPEAEVLPSQASTLPQTTLTTTPQMCEDNADDESAESIYSDAYEELSEVDGDGFQSLNAVVESPVNKKNIKQVSELPAETPTEPGQSKAVVQPVLKPQLMTASPHSAPTKTDWEQAKLFWRSLTEDKRRQLEFEAREDAGAEGDREDVQSPVRRLNSRKKTAEQKAAAVAGMKARAMESTMKPVQPINADRVYMIQPGSKANHEPLSPATPTGRFRASMRKQPTVADAIAGEIHMRKSMRPKTATAIDNQETSRRVVSQPDRPLSWSTSSGKSQTARPISYDHATSSARNAATQIQPNLRRKGSDASESSFKRSRASPQGFGFRRTMRQSSAPQSSPEDTRDSGRFSMRSLSPSGSPFRRTSVNTGSGPPVSGMRRTLRSGSQSSHEGKHLPLHFPSFGRSNKASASNKKSKRVSRFGDSSDEDEPVTSRFRSRFVDSSDEEDVQASSSGRPLSKGTLRGSKSAPVAEAAEDSPDLPDSNDEEPSMLVPSPMGSPQTTRGFRPGMPRSNSGIGTSTLRRQRSGRGMLVTSPTTPAVTTEKRRNSSFIGSILRRKKADQAGKIHRSELTESAARRDTKLERNASQLRDLRSEMESSSPKLQKRQTYTRGDSWPLPDIVDERRPSTSVGLEDTSAIEPTRPSFTGRRSTSLGLPGVVDMELDLGEKEEPGFKKKKKFGTLRRMFRLDD